MTAKEYLIEITKLNHFYKDYSEKDCLRELIESHKRISQELIDRPKSIEYQKETSLEMSLLKDKLERIQEILDE